jgi:hypothetical protein
VRRPLTDWKRGSGSSSRQLLKIWQQNILIKARPPSDVWWIKIGDFGISKIFEQASHFAATVRGTLGFMAPEMLGLVAGHELKGVEAAKVADMWAVGETVAQVLTRTPTFGNDISRLGEYAQGRIPFPAGALHDAGVHPTGQKFVKRLLDPEPSSRPDARSTLQHPWINLGHAYAQASYAEGRKMWCKGQEKPVMLFADNDTKLLVVASDGIARFDTETTQCLKTLTSDGHRSYRAAAMSSNGQRLAVCGPPGWLWILDAATFEPLVEICLASRICKYLGMTDLEARHVDSLRSDRYSAAFSPDDAKLAVAAGKLILIFDAQPPFKVEHYEPPVPTTKKQPDRQFIRSLCFTADSMRLLVAYDDHV